MKISFIVPCYNEVENVEKIQYELLPVIKKLTTDSTALPIGKIHSAEMIFVDDGSRDGTFSSLVEHFQKEETPEISIKFLKHEINQGLGAAIRTGFANSVGEIVVTVDSDGTYKFSEIPALLAYLTPGVDIVTASPYHPKGEVVGVPANRLILSRGSSLIYRILLDWHVYTYTCLFRAYRSQVVKSIEFRSNGFLAGTELLVKAMLQGYHVVDFPAALHRRMYGVSKAKIAQTITAHLGFQAKVFLYRIQTILGFKPKPIT
ncbi:MAG: glycosyltransferase family 2 protein [Anaerolineaceae bacterium]|nr:glycosyltransferase family 2 protein [Anaerolineaceae bacterium]